MLLLHLNYIAHYRPHLRCYYFAAHKKICCFEQINSIFWRLFYYLADVSPTYSSRLPKGNVFNHIYAILLHLVWLNSKKLGFILFLLYSHKGWTAALVCHWFYSLLDSGWDYLLPSTVNCTSATSYNYDATITFFLTAQQWTTNDATTLNISCSAICTKPPV